MNEWILKHLKLQTQNIECIFCTTLRDIAFYIKDLYNLIGGHHRVELKS